ncbi:MAG: polyprenyl diphosphate synthase, partial [Gammaproteobacteria bacterium]
LMDLLLGALTSEIPELHRNGGGVHFIGARTRFSAALQTGMREAERLTQANTRLRLNVAAGYGGRRDLVEAARWLAGGVAAGQILPADIDAALLGQHLALGDGPDPELFIRTGGKPRIRNFLLWNLAYTELYFTNTPWPDIDAGGLQTALHWFAERERRFGGVRELSEAKSGA